MGQVRVAQYTALLGSQFATFDQGSATDDNLNAAAEVDQVLEVARRKPMVVFQTVLLDCNSITIRILLGVFAARYFSGCMYLLSCWYLRSCISTVHKLPVRDPSLA